jgi:hypothetical protein
VELVSFSAWAIIGGPTRENPEHQGMYSEKVAGAVALKKGHLSFCTGAAG